MSTNVVSKNKANYKLMLLVHTGKKYLKYLALQFSCIKVSLSEGSFLFAVASD